MKTSTVSTLVLCLLLITVALSGCRCNFDPPEARYAPAETTRHAVKAWRYDSVPLGWGDTIDLEFRCAPTLPALPQWLDGDVNGRVASLWRVPSKRSTSPTALVPSPPLPRSAPINFTSPPYRLSVMALESVQPGDANNDGVVNMLDLYPLALIHFRHGFPWSIPSASVTPPALDPTQHYLRNPTGRTWTLTNSNRVIDYVHADCNMDGIVDKNDVQYIRDHLTPLLPPRLLTGGYTGVRLKAVQSGDLEVLDLPGMDHPEVRVWYNITLQNFPAKDSILGVVFSRPVAESRPASSASGAPYEVLSVQGKMDGSDLFPDGTPPAAMLGHQHFWTDIPIGLKPQCDNPASNAVSKPLDVGVFNVDAPQYLTHGNVIISCGVTIDDIFKAVSQNGAPIVQHLSNVVIYSIGPSGQVTATFGACDFDQISLTTSNTIQLTEAPTDWYSKQ